MVVLLQEPMFARVGHFCQFSWNAVGYEFFYRGLDSPAIISFPYLGFGAAAPLVASIDRAVVVGNDLFLDCGVGLGYIHYFIWNCLFVGLCFITPLVMSW